MSDHGHKHDLPIDPARELIGLIHPTLLKIQAGVTPTSPPLTALDIFQQGVALLSTQIAGGPSSPPHVAVPTII